MKIKIIIIAIGLFILLVNGIMAFGSFTGTEINIKGTTYYVAKEEPFTAEKMFEYINISREINGLKLLRRNEKLDLVAKMKAEDMFKNQYFEHTSPSGITAWYWFKEADYDYIYASENIAIDFELPIITHKAFMKSEGHRSNILSEYAREIGIAVVKGEFEGRETYIVVEEFGVEKYEHLSEF